MIRAYFKVQSPFNWSVQHCLALHRPICMVEVSVSIVANPVLRESGSTRFTVAYSSYYQVKQTSCSLHVEVILVKRKTLLIQLKTGQEDSKHIPRLKSQCFHSSWTAAATVLSGNSTGNFSSYIHIKCSYLNVEFHPDIQPSTTSRTHFLVQCKYKFERQTWAYSWTNNADTVFIQNTFDTTS